jgi:asparagine synthase (glutamine-hydrolysing)
MLIAGLITFSPYSKHVNDKFLEIIRKKYQGEKIQFYSHGDLQLACSDFPLLTLKNNVVIGRMISKKDNISVKAEEFDETFNNDDIAKNYWGDYVVISNNRSRNIKIYVSASGQQPIFYYLNESSLIFSNQIHFIKDMVSGEVNFNWNYLAKFLVNGNFTGNETPFNNIFEINPGSLLSLSEGKASIKHIWSPSDYLEVQDSTDYSVMTPDILFHTLDAWLKPFNTFCLDFSGGLDSTSLAFTLDRIIKSSPGKKLIGINAFHPEVNSSNETKYAKATATHLGMNFVEFNYEKHLPFTPIDSKSRKLNKPSIVLSHEKFEQEIGAISNSFDSPIAISGHGGDSLFMGPPTLSSIADYFIHNGYAGLKTKIFDLCVHTRSPIYQVIKHGVIQWLRYRLRMDGRLRSSQYFCADWINKSLIDSYDIEVTHQIANSKKCLPGKKEHIIAILDTVSNINVNLRNDKHPTFYPFLQQPLLEMALSMPTYLSLQQGHDRFLFRKGISEYFQTQSVWRKGKGETSGVVQLGLIANFQHVSDLCLEGLMAKNGYIDKSILLNHLRLIEGGHVQYAQPLIYLFCLEKFISYWS